MEFFISLPETTKLYRSVKNITDLTGYWYCFTPDDTYGYGSITVEFKPKKELRLLNIEDNSFYNDLINKIKETNKIGILEIDDVKLLFPLGFSDFEVYKQFTKAFKIPSIDTPKINIELASQFYQNRSRYSIKILNDALMTFLNSVYGREYDGIIAKHKLPNRLLGGYHHSEMAVFNKDTIEFVSEIPRSQGGGINLSEYQKILQDKSPTLIALDLRTPEIMDIHAGMQRCIERVNSLNLHKNTNHIKPKNRRTRKKKY